MSLNNENNINTNEHHIHTKLFSWFKDNYYIIIMKIILMLMSINIIY